VTIAILIDTHFVLWLRTRPQSLTSGERNALEGADLRYISAVSLWEIAILLAKRRIPGDEQLLEIPQGFEMLPIAPAHCHMVMRLPQLHGDPFDRMLVAQAQSERVPLLTRDRAIALYREHATILRFPEA
jgi:PIN domain nuclease of toxin-antitoxin system